MSRRLLRAIAPSRASGLIVPVQARSGSAPDMLTIRDALNSALDDELERDADVFLIGEEVGQYQGAYKITRGLLQKYGERRVLDTPITEAGFGGLACGAAFGGLKPVCEFMTFNFAMQAMDHLINSAGKTLYMSAGQLPCPVTFRGPNGSAAGVAAQHSQDYTSWYAHCPGLKVVVPYDVADCRGLLKASIRDPNPVVFLENELLYSVPFPVPDPTILSKDYVLPLGEAHIAREGEDITLVSYGKPVGECLEAAKTLEQMGVSAEVLNLRTIRPLDKAAIVRSVMKTHRILSVDETWPFCGVGSEMAAILFESPAWAYLDAPFARVTQADCPLPYSQHLEAECRPTVDDVVRRAAALCGIREHPLLPPSHPRGTGLNVDTVV